MPGNAIHGIEAVSTSNIGLGIVKQGVIQSVLQTPAWGCGGYKIGCGHTGMRKEQQLCSQGIPMPGNARPTYHPAWGKRGLRVKIGMWGV